MSSDTCQKKKKNQILSRTFNEELEDSEVSHLSNVVALCYIVSFEKIAPYTQKRCNKP